MKKVFLIICLNHSGRQRLVGLDFRALVSARRSATTAGIQLGADWAGAQLLNGFLPRVSGGRYIELPIWQKEEIRVS